MALTTQYFYNSGPVRIGITYDDADPAFLAKEVVAENHSTLYKYTFYCEDPVTKARLVQEVPAETTAIYPIPNRFRKKSYDSYSWGAYASSPA